MTADLAAQAERRTLLASTLGRLLLAEPGTGLDPLVAQLPALADLADAASAVDYERVFLRAVPPYESVFRSDDGRQGGPVAAAVDAAYAEAMFDEHRAEQWRIASPDHLGLELRFHAVLVQREEAAWGADRPDHAAEAVDDERRFLAAHLGTWAFVAIRALRPAAVDTPYALVLDLVGDFLAEEVERLRPAPMLGPIGVVDGGPARGRPLGSGRLAQHLLTPGRSGVWFGVEEIAAAATPLGVPWRPMDGRGRLRQIIDGASEAGELPLLLDALRASAVASAAWYRQGIEQQPGIGAIWTEWAQRAERTVELLDAAHDVGVDPQEEGEVVLRVIGPDVDRAAPLLEAAGFTVTTELAPGPATDEGS